MLEWNFLISCFNFVDNPVCILRNSDINLWYGSLTVSATKWDDSQEIPRLYSVVTLIPDWIVDEKSTSRISTTCRLSKLSSCANLTFCYSKSFGWTLGIVKNGNHEFLLLFGRNSILFWTKCPCSVLVAGISPPNDGGSLTNGVILPVPLQSCKGRVSRKWKTGNLGQRVCDSFPWKTDECNVIFDIASFDSVSIMNDYIGLANFEVLQKWICPSS